MSPTSNPAANEHKRTHTPKYRTSTNESQGVRLARCAEPPNPRAVTWFLDGIGFARIHLNLGSEVSIALLRLYLPCLKSLCKLLSKFWSLWIVGLSKLMWDEGGGGGLGWCILRMIELTLPILNGQIYTDFDFQPSFHRISWHSNGMVCAV
jgi:hypothetical protein